MDKKTREACGACQLGFQDSKVSQSKSKLTPVYKVRAVSWKPIKNLQ